MEVLYDDRAVRAGVMFSDADLLGVPLRVTVSPRNLEQGVLEVVSRDKSLSVKIPLEQGADALIRMVSDFRKAEAETKSNRKGWD